MAEAKAMEASGQGYPGSPHPAPVPAQPSAGYHQPPYPPQPANYTQQQVVLGIPQQPIPPVGGSRIRIATQSSMIMVGQPSNTYAMGGYQPQVQQAALIRQPVSVAFGAPLIQPGMSVIRPTQQMQPVMPSAPPPYPGPPQTQGNVKYDVPGAPKNLYGK